MDLGLGAIVLTGCDSGLGFESALTLSSRGYRVFAVCLTADGVSELNAKAVSLLSPVQGDVTKEESVKTVLATVKAAVGDRGLFALISNAGVMHGTRIEFSNIKDYEITMNVNFFGAVRFCLAFMDVLVKHPTPRIVCVSSVGGTVAFPGLSAYCASKWALEGFCDALRMEVSPFGVQVALVEPSGFATKLGISIQLARFQKGWQEAPAEKKERYGNSWYEGICKTLDPDAMAKNSSACEPVSVIVNTIVSATTAKHLKARYRVGIMHKFLLYALTKMPTVFVDAMLTSQDPPIPGFPRKKGLKFFLCLLLFLFVMPSCLPFF